MRNRKLFKTILLLAATFLVYYSAVSFYNDNTVLNSSVPPTGRTGLNGVSCNSCHGAGNGGSVMLTGLPATYSAGKQYDFSVTTTHSAADRKRWGFSIIAVNSNNQPVGAFSSTNANAAVNGNELSHLNAVQTEAKASYTYNNLRWTAPSAPGPAEKEITFYFAANAANGNFSSSGDFIYTGTLKLALAQVFTFTGNGNWNNPSNWSNSAVPPANLSGSAEIVISPSVSGECILNVPQTIGAGARLTINPGARFTVPELKIPN